MRIVAIDPGEKTGVAIKKGGTETRVRQKQELSIQEIVEFLRLHKPDIVLIEDQYMGRKRGLKELLRRRFAWEVTAQVLGIRTLAVMPLVWMKHHGLKKTMLEKKDSKRWKERIREYATGSCGRVLPPDGCDAYLMLEWYRDTGGESPGVSSNTKSAKRPKTKKHAHKKRKGSKKGRP